MPDFSIGVDLGGTNLRIAAVTPEGQLLEKVTLPSKAAPTRDEVIDQMCSAIQHLSAKYKAAGTLLGAGIGIPGIIDMQTGMLRKSANLPGWEDYPVQAEIERRLSACGLLGNDARVVLENDANVAALGEQWLGAARGIPNMAVATLGTGIGGGIVLEGKIWHGMNGMAGEFGHVTLEPQGHPCGCGNRGCAEQYASATAILRMAREAIATGHAPSLAHVASDPEFGASSIYNLAQQGDAQAREIFQTFGRYLGILLAGLINVLNLDMFVLGGGVSSAWDAYAPTMFEELRKRSLVYAATAPEDPMLEGKLAWEKNHVRTAAPPALSAVEGPVLSGVEGAVQSERSSLIASDRKTIITRALLGSDAGLYGAARLAAPAP